MSFRRRLSLSVFFGIGLLSTSDAWSQRADIFPPARRASSVEQAAKLLEQAVVPAVLPSAKNPFAPPDFDRVDPVEAPPSAGPAQRSRTLREVLELIAASLNPTGTAMIRDQPILLFGARQMKIGDRIPATLDGAQYTVEITGIERTSFTVRLNDEQISRPIKPGSKQ